MSSAVSTAQAFRLSPQQRRLWALAREGGGAYRALAAVRLPGSLDVHRLEKALADVAARHEILRTVFPVPAGMSLPGQMILEDAPPRLELSGLLADLLWEEMATRPFHPDREPPFAVALAADQVLVISLHGLCADEASLGVLVRDLRRAYAGDPEDEPPMQYADVAAALEEILESDEAAAGREYWREILPAPPPLERLPFERDSERGFDPRRVEAALPSGHAPGFLLAAWQALLARLSPEAAGIVGVELPGRHYEGFETAIGPFAHSLPVRSAVTANLPFSELATRLEAQLAAMEDWQDYFAWEEGFFSVCFRHLEENPEEIERTWACTERFRLRLSVRGGRAELAYDASRFRENDVRVLLESWLRLLESAAINPDAPVGELEIATAILDGTEKPFDFVPVHRLFAEQARRTPDAVALSAAGENLTYRELAEKVAILSARLRQEGVGPETRVGICVERSAEMIVAVLAVLEAGGAYVPLDPGYPPARLSLMLEASRAPVLLTRRRLLDRFAGPVQARVLDLDETGPGDRVPGPEVHGENAAYVLFTSGSTGEPKGVVVRHRALTNHMLWMQETYPLGPGDRVLQKTPLSFDASVWELFAPLLAGAELVLADPDAHRDPARLVRVTAETGATVLQVVPSLLRLLLQEEAFAACSSLRRLYCGGEALTGDLRERFHALFPPGVELINLYGPTETTVQVTSWVAERAAGPVPIGRPIHNARVYVLDPGMLPIPSGLPGELWIGGEPLARGYLDRPDLTATAFLPDPFAGQPGARMYRTGDLGRRRDDGALEYLGRAGRQTKIRGYRFDPEEIEGLLLRAEGVREAAVLAREDRLIAYVVPRGVGADTTALRALLAEHLPDFLVPSAFLTLPALPRTPGGKLDRGALPDPPEESAAEPASAAPRTAAEEVLAGIWSDLLGRDRIGVHDDFFELGGHSLLGAQLVARVRQALGVEISLRTVFETPTVAGLAQRVTEAWRGTAGPPLERVPREGDIPLSFAQQRLWFLDRLAPGNPYYNVFSAVLFTGLLDEAALLGAFREIVRVQEALRTTFAMAGDRPVQRPARSLDLGMPVADLSALPPVERLPEARRLAHEEARRPFNLEAGPLLRLTLLRLGVGRSVLLTAMHHVVSDAWSVGVLYRDLTALYTAAVSGRPAVLPEPPVQYIDYAVWQRRWFETVREQELGYWRRQLADLPTLRLPADRPRPARQTFRGAAVHFALPSGLTAALRRIAHAANATPFMLLLAAFQALLHRYSGQEEVVAGSPVANRERAELEGIVGFFVNTLVLRTSLAGNPGFRELLGQVREVALGAYAHQSLPFEALVEELEPERDLGRQPLFQVMFQLQNVPMARVAMPGVEVEALDVDPGTAPFDLGLDLIEIPEGMAGVLRYSTDLFDPATMRRFVAHWSTLLRGIAEEPDRRVGDLPLLGEAERHQLGVEWNDTGESFDYLPLHLLFRDRAAMMPEAVAVIFEGEELTYGELDRRADRLARRLRTRGVEPAVPVCVLLDRSLDLPVAILAVWKAGGVFVPLDPDSPRPRLEMMMEDVLAIPGAVLLTREDLDAEDDDEPAMGENTVGADDPAFIIFTSGTSGRPKGVVVEHLSLVNFLRVVLGGFGWRSGDRMPCLAAFTFDIFLFELLGPLLSGGVAEIVPLRPALDVDRLVERLPGFTRLHAVPSLMREIVDRLPSGVPGLRTVFVGGERVPDDLLADMRRVFPGAELRVLYGPTEGTVFCSTYPVPKETRSRIGRPVTNARLTVRDSYGNPAPVGVPGELVITGLPVARGYLSRPELTRERFVEMDGERGYHTGDLARRLPDGTLDFLGRADAQVKVRGFRVEPGEIEAALLAHPAVREAVVVAREDVPGQTRLVAYATCDLTDALFLEDRVEADRVERWRALYDTDVFGRGPEELPDPTFNISGWNASATGEPIPEPEMREWVDGTVGRLLATGRIDGGRVLEIGCGTGLLLFRLAPRSRRYLGTDFSASVLSYIESVLKDRSHVDLRRAAADDFTGIERGGFDVVVLNSVVQYFPSADYLARVIAGAVAAAAPGGLVFVGDVRSLPLLPAFHAGVEAERVPSTTSRERLARRAESRADAEPELVVDPAFFTALRERLPRIGRVEVQLRRGRHWNELTRFRYDVVLHLDREPMPEITEMAEWEALPFAALRERLASERPARVIVRGLANARVAAEVALVDLLSRQDGPATAGELRREAAKAGGIDPEDVRDLGRELGYAVAVTWSSEPGGFDAVFARDGEAAPPPPAPAAMPLTSDPLRESVVRRVAPRLRAFLTGRLPDWMVPATVVLLPRLPRNAHGKLDHAALPDPERLRPDLESDLLAPRTPTEAILAAVWAEVLGLDRVGVRDDFFELGGHSLLATQVVSRLRQALGIEVELRALFEAPTVERLAARLDTGRTQSQAPPIRPVPRDGRELPLSFAQRRLWFLDRLAPGDPSYAMLSAVRVRGSLDPPVLAACLDEIARRHEVLRTRIVAAEGRPAQVVDPPSARPLPLADLSALPALLCEAEARRIALEEARRPFDLAAGPVLRASILRMRETEHVLLLAVHHIASDGWSEGILIGELTALHRAFAAGRPSPLPPLPVQYADFAAWQREWLSGEVLASQLGWWRERLAGAPPSLDLPADRPRPALPSGRGRVHGFHIADAGGVQALCRRGGATPFMVLLAAFDVLLGRLAGQEDVLVGTPIANRNRTETEGLIGFFVNTLVLRVGLAGEPSGREVLARVREAALGAYAHQDLPFERLVEELQPDRELTRQPLFQVLFVLQNAPRTSLELGGLAFQPLEVDPGTSKFDLALSLAEGGEGFMAAIEYSTDLFEAPTIVRFAERYVRVLGSLVADPERRIGELPLLSEAERHQILAEWNDTDLPAPEACLHELFEAQADRTPGTVAIADGEREVSYAELDRRADAVAHRLRGLGVGPEAPVGLCAGRSVDLVAGILGTLKAGGVYVPLDPAYPRERRILMIEDAGIGILVGDGPRLAELAGAVDRTLLLENVVGDLPAGRLAGGAGPENLAYILYTSGSTGRPKGVALRHRGAVALLLWAREVFSPRDLAGGLAAGSIGFDISIIELFAPLSWGGTVILSQGPLDIPDLPRPITLVNAVSAVLAELLRQDRLPATAGTVAVGGEAVPASLVRDLYARGVGRVLHLYGPSEATTHSTFDLAAPGTAGPPPIGRPIPGTRAYVLDERLEPVPAVAAGELYLGGLGLARGYAGRPDLTAGRFPPSPFGPPGERLYRTGDRARQRADGRLEFLGRLDHQVKIRGVRVEPGEIEAVLASHPEVRQAAVLALDDPLRLVAFVAGEPDAAGLRAYLRERLPEAMIPSTFVVLPALPLTPNGKLDRAALPASGRPRLDPEEGPLAPSTPTESILAAVWAEVLGLDRIGVRDDFFELGGHSLLATQVVSRLRQALGVEVELRALFEAPTIERLAARLDAGRVEAQAPPLRPVPRDDRELPLSFAQQRLWFLDRLAPGDPSYTMLSAVRVRGPLLPPVLAACLDEIARRHEVLRTRIVAAEGRPAQVVDPPSARPLPLADLAALPREAREAEARRIALEEARRPFDLAAGPVLRASLLRLREGEHVLLLAVHHIASDGWSEGILIGELTALHRAFAAGRPSPLPPLPVQYADFASWQRAWLSGAVLDRQLGWWRERLAGAPPSLDLPADHPRPAMPSGRGRIHAFRIPAAAAEGVRALCHREGATPFMVLLAAFDILLGRLAGQEDMLVGTPIANRNHAETEGLIGFFVNTLVMRVNLAGEPSGREVLARVREAALGAYAHQDLPFERLVEELRPERERTRQPLFQVLFALQNAPRTALELGGLAFQPLEVDPATSKFDLALSLAENDDGFVASIGYSTDLFEAPTIAGFAERYARLLGALVADPDRRVGELPLLSEAERHQAVTEGNDTGLPEPEACLHELFEAQADRTPEAVAIVDGAREVTYAELERRANGTAHRLRRLGVGPETPVGVCMQRSAALVAALLGVLKAGGAYVPLDPSHPRERREVVMADARIKVLLEDADVEDLPAGRLAGGAGPDNLAYILYTSGSTGRPKGVALRHRGAVSLLRWAREVYGPRDLAGVLAATSIGFDLSVFELFAPLAWGGTVILAQGPLEIPADPRITLVNTVPSVLAELLRQDRLPATAATVNLAGEALPASLVRELYARGVRRVFNLYGPSEDTTYSTGTLVEPGSDVPLIGRPLPGGRAWVLDERLEPVPAGAAGELCLGGVGLARGYLGRPDLTAERFVPSSFGSPGERLYRTGDRARHLPDGRLEFLGRLDHQIKLRGVRIEPGEIEAVLASHPGVRQAVVLALQEGGLRLVAFVAGEPDSAELRAFLRERLPEAMIPAAFVALPALPLTPNGKVDRAALVRSAPASRDTEGTGTLANPVEEVLAGIWSEVLGIGSVGRDDNFFELSGHSLLAAQVAYRIERAFGVSIPLRRFFERATLAELAAEVEEARRRSGAGAPPVPPLETAPRDLPLPASSYQEWAWRLQGGPVSARFNMPLALRLRGPLDVHALERSLGELVARHEILRTSLRPGDEGLVQEVLPSLELLLPVVDLDGRGEAARDLALAEARRPFDLTRAPLMRVLLLRLDAEDHVLAITLHHAASDGWSLELLQRELAALYAAFSEGRPSPLPPLAYQYADFAHWQRRLLEGAPLETQLEGWRRRLEGLTPPPDLPSRRPRPARLGPATASAGWTLPAGLARNLQALVRAEGCTLSMVLLATLDALLHRYTGREDLLVATVLAGRSRPELAGVLGLLMNTVPVRADLSGAPAFRALLLRVRDSVLDAYGRQDVSFPRLFTALFPQHGTDRTAVVRIAFNMLSFPHGPAAPEPSRPALSIEGIPVAEESVLYDLALSCREEGGALHCRLTGAADLFDPEDLAAMGRDFTELLTEGVAEPETRLDRLLPTVHHRP